LAGKFEKNCTRNFLAGKLKKNCTHEFSGIPHSHAGKCTDRHASGQLGQAPRPKSGIVLRFYMHSPNKSGTDVMILK
jgi:hypothetical protein